MRILVDVITVPGTNEIIIPCLFPIDDYLKSIASPEEIKIALEIMAMIDYWVNTEGETLPPEDLDLIRQDVAENLHKLEETKRAWNAENN
jgi:hypothetical protein